MSPERDTSHPGDQVASLRGPAVAGSGRTLGLIFGGTLLVVAAVALVIGFLAAASDNDRISRLKSSGVPVSITVTGCTGNLGGSGSNGAGYTCRGSYQVSGTTYDEVIGGLGTFIDTGGTISGVADPAHLGTVVTTSSLATTTTSSKTYVILGALTLGFVALTGWFVVVVRRHVTS